jgi:hypothetical protein
LNRQTLDNAFQSGAVPGESIGANKIIFIRRIDMLAQVQMIENVIPFSFAFQFAGACKAISET